MWLVVGDRHRPIQNRFIVVRKNRFRLTVVVRFNFRRKIPASHFDVISVACSIRGPDDDERRNRWRLKAGICRKYGKHLDFIKIRSRLEKERFRYLVYSKVISNTFPYFNKNKITVWLQNKVSNSELTFRNYCANVIGFLVCSLWRSVFQ